MKKKTLESRVHDIGQEIPFQETTELGQVFENLDSDKVNVEGRSALDMNSNLTQDQINSITTIDEIKAFGLLPPEVGITTTTKRLSLSKDSLGRKQKVSIVTGQREQQSGNVLKRLFQKREG